MFDDPFVGQYERSLDSKFRIVLPKKYREALGRQVYLARARNSLAVYSAAQYKENVQRLIARDRNNELTPGTRLAFGATSVSVEPDDKTGRITLPPELREHANLTNEVIVAGVLTHVEIWEKSAFEEFQAKHLNVVQEQFIAGGEFN